MDPKNYNDPKKPNIKVLRPFRVQGDALKVGQVVSKREFNKPSDWQNLCNMTPAKAEETDEQVGMPAVEEEVPAKKPAKGKAGGLPSASG